MRQKIYQIDAFAEQVFEGNPAAVCILDSWIDASTMQKIAMENNLAETAFAVRKESSYELRWFTPENEVDLCGHATLATAYVLFNYYGHTTSTILFMSPRSGELQVSRSEDDYLILDFPTDQLEEIKERDDINEAIGAKPLKTFKGKTDYLLIYSAQKDIENITPNFHLLDKIDCRGVIISAAGDSVDFVSRFFAPQCGIPEDPVTGSAHTTLTPYWANTLGKSKLIARQLSNRGGQLHCEYLGERVKIAGKAVPYLIGEINVQLNVEVK